MIQKHRDTSILPLPHNEISMMKETLPRDSEVYGFKPVFMVRQRTWELITGRP